MKLPAPQSTNVKADYKVMLDVQQFDSALGDAATLEVLWSVQPTTKPTTKGGELKTGRAVVREPTGSDKGDKAYDALVAAHSRALKAVSHDIAAAIQP